MSWELRRKKMATSKELFNQLSDLWDEFESKSSLQTQTKHN